MMYDLYRVCHLEFSCLLPLYLLPCAFSPRCSGSSVGSPSRLSSFRRSAFELTSLHPFFYTRPRARRAGMAAGRKAPSPALAPAVADPSLCSLPLFLAPSPSGSIGHCPRATHIVGCPRLHAFQGVQGGRQPDHEGRDQDELDVQAGWRQPVVLAGSS